jgi:hypothetical protein
MPWDYDTIKTPAFWIEINGKRLTDVQHKFIEEVVYEDHATGSDICSVTISDPNFEFISDPIFAKSTKFKLIGGYLMKHRTMLDGFISAVDYIYPQDNTPQLSIYAMDKSHILDRKEKKRKWENKTPFQIVQLIAQEYGLAFDGKANKLATKKEESISQSNETDMSLLMGLADQCEMLVYVKGNTLYFHERNYGSEPQAVLKYRQAPFDIIEFTPRFIQKDAPIEEDEQNINSKGETEKGKANESTNRPTTGDSGKPISELQSTTSPSPSTSKLIYDGDIRRVGE